MKIQNTNALYSPSMVRKTQLPVGEPSFSSTIHTLQEGSSIHTRLTDALHHVDNSQRVADLKLERLASGEDVDIHGTMIALQEADVTLRFAVSVRDKLLEGYQKIINMSI